MASKIENETVYLPVYGPGGDVEYIKTDLETIAECWPRSPADDEGEEE